MLEVRSLSKSFGDTFAIADISFTVPSGEVLAVLGPSGSGKSTLLSLIAGLLPPDSGDIFWDGGSLTSEPTHRRGFGLMFQDYALFPHLNVGGNVEFGLRNKEKRQITANVLERVGLKGFENREIQTLSGGEAQRVALARALAPRPRLLMLDEPLGALDRALREQLTGELRRLLREFGQTAIYVTHDQQEAFGIADRIMIMQAGRAVQIGTPEAVYRQPANEFVRGFLGPGKLIEGRVEQAGDGAAAIHTAVGQWPVNGNEELKAHDEVIMLLRAEGIRKRPQMITIHKLDHTGAEKIAYTGEVLERTETRVVVEALFARERMELGYVTLNPGDRLVEYFYSDRWYNVFAIFDADGGGFKGWYCNITRPAKIADGHIRAEDLALDFFVQPSGTEFILDEDEFTALPLTPEEKTAARAALAELRALAAARAGPFADLNATSRKP
ncbi:MAG: ATP-binding cassette domain-containing protein [Chloroflexota bacterium]